MWERGGERVRFGTSCGFISSEACQIFSKKWFVQNSLVLLWGLQGSYYTACVKIFSTIHDAKFAINKESLNFKELTNWLAIVDLVSCRVPMFYFCWCICNIQSNFFSQVSRLSFPKKWPSQVSIASSPIVILKRGKIEMMLGRPTSVWSDKILHNSIQMNIRANHF